MKTYLKIFIVSGSLFGLGMGLFFGVTNLSLVYGVSTGLFAGLSFGFLMSLVLGTINIISTKKLKSKSRDSVRQTKIIELRMMYDRAYDLCKESLGTISGTVEQEDRSLGKIIAKTGMTWKSFGETIQFDVGKIDNEKTQVHVSSKPALRTTLVDCGKNFENVEKITEFLENNK